MAARPMPLPRWSRRHAPVDLHETRRLALESDLDLSPRRNVELSHHLGEVVLHRVGADEQRSFAFTRRGVAPELGSHFLLPRIVGFSQAADLLNVALEYTHDIALECSPTSTAIVKELLWSALDLDQAEVRRIELRLFGWSGAATTHAKACGVTDRGVSR